MPEGPQCHLCAARLEDRHRGQLLKSVVIHSGRYSTHGPFLGWGEMSRVCPIRLLGVGCHGKLIILFFANGGCLKCTLGLTGGWALTRSKHSGVSLGFERNTAWFTDQMHFGTLQWIGLGAAVTRLREQGPDVCDQEVGIGYFKSLLERSARTHICKVLMDQKKLAGIGNYLKAEILYAAGIAPSSACGSIPEDKVVDLLREVNRIPKRDRDALIMSKRSSRSLAVYGKKKDPGGNPVIRSKTSDGRSSYWSPRAQVVY